MGILARLGQWRQKSFSENITTEQLYLMLSGGKSKSGPAVNATSAMICAAVLGCVRVIAEDIGKLPFKIYQSIDKEDDRRRRLAREHPLYKLLSVRPNALMTAQEFREGMTASAALMGDGIAIKTRSPVNGNVLELIPVLRDLVEIKQLPNLDLVYTISLIGGGKKDFDSRDIFHLRGPCLTNFFTGTRIIKQAREAIGLSLSYEEYQAAMSAKGVTPPGILTTDVHITPEQRDAFIKVWKEKYGGSLNGGETPILGGGFKYQQIGLNGRDAQQIENRKFQIMEICRFFRVHPNKIFGSEMTQTYASAEQFAVDHVVDTIMPWAVRWEQTVERELLSDQDITDGYYAKMPLQALMRGDSAARVGYYKGMREITVLSVNDILALEDLDVRSEPEFDDPRMPLNTNPLPQGAASPAGDPNVKP